MGSDTGIIELIDLQWLMRLLPHRYPFLLVDKVINADGDNSGIGIKNVTANEPHFAGHFPGNPVMPGVLIIEGMAQTAAAIAIASRGKDHPELVYFMTIDHAKFRKPVFPGDTIEYHIQKIRRRGNIWKFQATALVDGAKVAEALLGAQILDESAEAE